MDILRVANTTKIFSGSGHFQLKVSMEIVLEFSTFSHRFGFFCIFKDYFSQTTCQF